MLENIAFIMLQSSDTVFQRSDVHSQQQLHQTKAPEVELKLTSFVDEERRHAQS